MKAKYIFAASLLVAGAAFADTTEVETSYVVGVFPLTLQANVAETAIFVPWIESGGTTGVAVSNLVKTAGLVANDGVNVTKGDELLWYDGSKFEAWELTTNSTDGVSYWVSAAQGAAADAQRIARGQSIILKRNNGVASATTVYIVGQYTSSGASSSIAAGSVVDNGAGWTTTTPTWSLIAPPNVGDTGVDLTTKFNSTGAAGTFQPAEGDVIRFVNSEGKVTNYTWGKITATSTFGWGKGSMSGSTYVFVGAAEGALTIRPGTGFWYKRVGTTGGSVTW